MKRVSCDYIILNLDKIVLVYLKQKTFEGDDDPPINRPIIVVRTVLGEEHHIYSNGILDAKRIFEKLHELMGATKLC